MKWQLNKNALIVETLVFPSLNTFLLNKQYIFSKSDKNTNVAFSGDKILSLSIAHVVKTGSVGCCKRVSRSGSLCLIAPNKVATHRFQQVWNCMPNMTNEAYSYSYYE